MRKSMRYFVMGINVIAMVIVMTLVAFGMADVQVKDILAGYQNEAEYSGLTISYPLDETLFPPEIVPPTFRWEDTKSASDNWLITISFQDDQGRMNFLARGMDSQRGRMGDHKDALPGKGS